MTPASLIPIAQTAIAAPAAAVDAIAGLKSGQIITAKVLEILGQSLARLDIGGSKIDVLSQTPLDTGTSLSLKVDRQGSITRLVPVQQETGAKTEATAPAPRGAVTVLPGRAAAASSMVASAPAVPNASVLQQSQAMHSARADQVLRVAQQAASETSIPQVNPVRVLQAKLAVDAASILNNLKTVSTPPLSESNSKVTAVPDSKAVSQSVPASENAAVREAAARQALVQLASQDAGRQASLTSLFADAKQVLSIAQDKLPVDVRDALTRVLGFRIPAEKPISGEALRSAFQKSGVLLEAKLGEAVRQAGSGQVQTNAALPGGDLKTALLSLKQKLSSFLKSQPPAEGTSKQVPARSSNLPPPPVRSGPMKGQPAVEPSISARMPASQATQILMEETRSAISRLRLMQNSSLPPQADSSAGRSTLARLEWNFEIPLAFGGRTDMAQIRIEGEGGENVETSRRPWNVHVSLDTQETGIVSGAVMLQGSSVSVNLWADRNEMVELFLAHEAELDAVLKDAGLDVERLRIRHGVRQAEHTPPGRMLDQSQ